MGFICEIIKKEFTEILSFKKSLFFYIIVIPIMIYMGVSTDGFSIMDGGLIDTGSFFNNANVSCYLISLMMSLASLQLMAESFLSDKRNQTLEVMIAAGKLNSVFFAKMITAVILCSVPFAIYYCYSLTAGLNILHSIPILFDTLLYFWIGGCAAAMMIIFFNDERSAAIPGIIIILLICVLARAMFVFNERYSETLGTALLFLIAAGVTFLATVFYKHTKMYLLNM